MFPDGYELHPVRTNLMPVAQRFELVTADLKRLETELAEQQTVTDHAHAAARAVLQEESRQVHELPYTDELELFLPGKGDKVELDTVLDNRITGSAARKKHVASPSDAVTKKLLVDIHPDKRSKDDTFSADFSAITSAPKDTIKPASHIARIAARKPDEHETIEKLELRRYVAYIAKNRGKSQFDSIEQVDEWMEKELAAAPLTARYSAHGILFGHLMRTVAEEDGGIKIRSKYQGEQIDAISKGLEYFNNPQLRRSVRHNTVSEFQLSRLDSINSQIIELLATVSENESISLLSGTGSRVFDLIVRFSMFIQPDREITAQKEKQLYMDIGSLAINMSMNKERGNRY